MAEYSLVGATLEMVRSELSFQNIFSENEQQGREEEFLRVPTDYLPVASCF